MIYTITLFNGDIFSIQWAGISSITGELIFDLDEEMDLISAVSIFGNINNMSEVIVNDGKDDTIYSGYTRVTSVSYSGFNNRLRVSMARDDIDSEENQNG